MQTGEGKLPQGAGFNLFGAGLLALTSIVMITFAVVAGETDQRIIIAILGPFLLGLAYYLYRLYFPPKLRHVQVSLVDDVVDRGKAVDVRLELRNPVKPTDRYELGLVCIEYYEVKDGSGTNSRIRTEKRAFHEEWRPLATGAAGGRSESFDVPVDAPYTYPGQVVSFEWRVTVRKPRRGADRAVSARVLVFP